MARSRVNLPADAIRIFDKMVDFGILPSINDLYRHFYALRKRKHVSIQDFVHKGNRALRLISRMDDYGCQLDRHTYNMVLKMLIRVGRFARVEKVWDSMDERGFYPSVSTYAVMVHGLCKKKHKLEVACDILR
ncbi:hypothetical protein ACH5RR_024731 [Cinchona calisaya]|uniref:Pentatricopeptide repeat-containing protein n=1 Tax=Cinchona calisaya TaxID=153742 RepID=A0ABD2YYP8_9GENT